MDLSLKSLQFGQNVLWKPIIISNILQIKKDLAGI